jgi:hypothetical protein
MSHYQKLPSWEMCETACSEVIDASDLSSHASPLEFFIYEFEPGGNDKEFREALAAVLNYAGIFKQGKPDTEWVP